MGTALGRTSADLIDDLIARAPAFEFFQAVQLLDEAGYEAEERPGGLEIPVRFRCAPELSFPVGDIRRCRLDERRRLVFELGFMGLYGVDAPVPHYFLEAVARADEPGQTVRGFLDLFSHRIYELLYLAWRKPRSHRRGGDTDSIFRRYLNAFGGRGGSRPWLELAFAGPLGGRIKSAAGLAGVLEEFSGAPTEVRQFVPTWVELEAVSALGSDEMVLGENALLGQRMLDFSRRIEIRIGPVPLDRAMSLLPGGADASDLAHLVRVYLDPTMEFDLLLQVDAAQEQPLRLGCEPAILGWTTALGRFGNGGHEIRLPGSAYRK